MPVTLVSKYNPEWLLQFQAIQKVLKKNLAGLYLRIEHVGSTSIPGMVAKPIIDLDIVIQERNMQNVIAALEKIGYIHQGDLGIPQREAFDLEDPELKSKLPCHHLYVCPETSPELERHLCFRDFLRKHPEYASQLSALKWSLAERHDNDRQAYMDGKDALVKDIIRRALAEFGSKRVRGHTFNILWLEF